MEAPDLWSFQVVTAEQSHIDFLAFKVEQFKATNNQSSHLYWWNISELDLNQTNFMNGAVFGLPVLSLSNKDLYFSISIT